MPTGRKFSSQRVKTHRPYTVDEAAKRFRCELSRWRDSRYMAPGWIGRGGANGSGRRLQGAAIHRRGDPVGRWLVSDVFPSATAISN